MTDSILDNVKKLIGIDPANTVFDTDVIMHINTVFATLNQLGIGPANGYMILGNTETWSAFIGTDPRLNNVKTYVVLRVRSVFDPPTTSFAIDAMRQQILELEWRINVNREEGAWTDPNPPQAPQPPPWWDLL